MNFVNNLLLIFTIFYMFFVDLYHRQICTKKERQVVLHFSKVLVKQLSHSLAAPAVCTYFHNACCNEICFPYRNKSSLMLTLKYMFQGG